MQGRKEEWFKAGWRFLYFLAREIIQHLERSSFVRKWDRSNLIVDISLL